MSTLTVRYSIPVLGNERHRAQTIQSVEGRREVGESVMGLQDQIDQLVATLNDGVVVQGTAVTAAVNTSGVILFAE